MDVHDKQTRSKNMSRIKSKDTRAELIVRQYLFKNGFRFRKNVKTIIGTPDIVLPKYRVIVDVRGCFWHSHKNCKFGDNVSTTSEVISKKIAEAKSRDIRNEKMWNEEGWRIFVVWDRCQLEDKKVHSDKRDKILNKLKDFIINN